MARLRIPLALIAMFSLIFSEWMVVAHMASVVDASSIQASSRSFISGSKDSEATCNCIFHQRRRAKSAGHALNFESLSGGESKVEPSEPSDQTSEHDAEHCSLCRAFYTSRTMSVDVPPPTIALEVLPVFSVAEYVWPAVEACFASAQSQRGPPAFSLV